MNPIDDIDFKELLEESNRQLRQSLAAMRTVESSDTVLVCGEEEFFAHRLILEASSEYFAKMLNAGLQESRTGRVVFDKMAPETLGFILDFLYLGNVDHIKSKNQWKNVFMATHMMEIKNLRHFCVKVLAATLTTENFFDVLDLATKYEEEILLKEVLDFWISHELELLSSKHFLLLRYDEINNIFEFLKIHGESLDNILLSFLSWVKHDIDDRGKSVVTLLDHIEVAHVTKQCAQQLLKSEDLKTMPEAFRSRFKDFIMNVLVSSDEVYPKSSHQVINFSCWSKQLVYFSAERYEECFDVHSECNIINCRVTKSCFQQLVLSTMTWLPVCDIKPEFCSNDVYSYKKNWCTVNDWKVSMFNPYSQSYSDQIHVSVSNGSICFFRGHLYIIKCYDNEICNHVLEKQAIPCIFCSSPESTKWKKCDAPLFEPSSLVLTTQYHMYVIDDSRCLEIIIHHNSSPRKKSAWEVFRVGRSYGLSARNFFIHENTLQALYLYHGHTKHLTYLPNKKDMKVSTFTPHPEEISKITRICVCAVDNHTVLYVSSKNDEFRIPDFTWDPKTGQWDRLPEPSGKREIPSTTSSLLVAS